MKSAFLWLSVALLWAGPAGAAERGEPYRSPFDVVAAPGGRTAYVSDRTAGVVAVVDLEGRAVLAEVPLRGQPTGLCLAPGGETLYAAEYDAGSVAEIDVRRRAVLRRLAVGRRPMGVALAPRRGLLLAANTVSDDLSLVDLASGREEARLRLPREPFFLAVTPDETLAVVGNLLPATSASEPGSSAAVSLIDLETRRSAGDIRLPPGSTTVREIALHPSGRFAYVAHTVGRFNLPTTQSERGWIYTNAVSVIDLAARELYTTFLLDTLQEGAGNPWGVEVSGDGRALWVGLRGTHQLALVDLERLHSLLEGRGLAEVPPYHPAGPGPRSFWEELRGDPSLRSRLVDDLAALPSAGLLRRFSAGGMGPRGLTLAAGGRTVLAALYHGGGLAVIEAASGRLEAVIPLGPRRAPDPIRRGEEIFHDATISFQHWMSCSSCHPDEGRTDGLRWDLVNDGLGTPQNTRSLLWVHLTRPTTARGVRPGIESSVPAGFHFLGVTPEPELVAPVTAYLSNLEPEPSPHLTPEGKLSESGERGRALFEGKAGCASCHHGPTRSDLKLHDVGTGELDRPGERFVTKRLVELYRTAPYLHDGRAATLREVFAGQDQRSRHGKGQDLGEAEREDLLAYLLSL